MNLCSETSASISPEREKDDKVDLWRLSLFLTFIGYFAWAMESADRITIREPQPKDLHLAVITDWHIGVRPENSFYLRTYAVSSLDGGYEETCVESGLRYNYQSYSDGTGRPTGFYLRRSQSLVLIGGDEPDLSCSKVDDDEYNRKGPTCFLVLIQIGRNIYNKITKNLQVGSLESNQGFSALRSENGFVRTGGTVVHMINSSFQTMELTNKVELFKLQDNYEAKLELVGELPPLPINLAMHCSFILEEPATDNSVSSSALNMQCIPDLAHEMYGKVSL